MINYHQITLSLYKELHLDWVEEDLRKGNILKDLIYTCI